MVDIEQYLAMFPFIGSILIFIALFTPAAVYEYSSMGVVRAYRYIWMCGLQLVYYKGYYQVNFSPFPIILIPSIFCSIITLIGNFLILNLVYKVWIGKRNIRDIEIHLLIIAAINIMISIFWMIIIEIAFFLISYRTFSFWSTSYPNFGIIGIFIGAIIILIGIAIKRKILRYK